MTCYISNDIACRSNMPGAAELCKLSKHAGCGAPQMDLMAKSSECASLEERVRELEAAEKALAGEAAGLGDQLSAARREAAEAQDGRTSLAQQLEAASSELQVGVDLRAHTGSR